MHGPYDRIVLRKIMGQRPCIIKREVAPLTEADFMVVHHILPHWKIPFGFLGIPRALQQLRVK